MLHPGQPPRTVPGDSPCSSALSPHSFLPSGEMVSACQLHGELREIAGGLPRFGKCTEAEEVVKIPRDSAESEDRRRLAEARECASRRMGLCLLGCFARCAGQRAAWIGLPLHEPAKLVAWVESGAPWARALLARDGLAAQTRLRCAGVREFTVGAADALRDANAVVLAATCASPSHVLSGASTHSMRRNAHAVAARRISGGQGRAF